MEDLLKKWNAYLDWLDRNHEGFEIFDHTSGKLSVKDLGVIIRGGLEALDKKVDEIRDLNESIEYAMFKSTYRAFLNDEGMEYHLSENEEDFRSEFECHINWNVEKLFDFQVLLIDSKRYHIGFNWKHSEIDESDPEQKSFKDEALKYISKEQLDEILENSFDETGFFAIIVNAQNIIRTIRFGNIVGSNELMVGIHDGYNDCDYSERSFRRVTVDKEYTIDFRKGELDYGKSSIGNIFGDVDWKWE